MPAAGMIMMADRTSAADLMRDDGMHVLYMYNTRKRTMCGI
jgi:hypothetical protein